MIINRRIYVLDVRKFQGLYSEFREENRGYTRILYLAVVFGPYDFLFNPHDMKDGACPSQSVRCNLTTRF